MPEEKIASLGEEARLSAEAVHPIHRTIDVSRFAYRAKATPWLFTCGCWQARSLAAQILPFT